MLDLNVRYKLDAPAGTISDTGIDLIEAFIQEQDPQSEAWKAKNPAYESHFLRMLPDDWQWVWKMDKGEYRGTFPKRVSKYYYKELGLRCPQEFVEKIGNLAKQHSEDNTHYDFEFVDEFTWQAGDYGDDGSCFWGGRSLARKFIAKNGGLAMLFYSKWGAGKARAWIAQLKDDQYIVFNGYGFPGNPTLICARTLSMFLDAKYKRIWLTNHGMDDGTVWINGGIGYLIGKPEQIDEVEEFDLQWGPEHLRDVDKEDSRF